MACSARKSSSLDHTAVSGAAKTTVVLWESGGIAKLATTLWDAKARDERPSGLYLRSLSSEAGSEQTHCGSASLSQYPQIGYGGAGSCQAQRLSVEARMMPGTPQSI